MRTIKNLLHIGAEVRDYDTDQLPIYLKAAYDISILHVAGVDCLLAKPKDTTNLVTLRKQRMQLKKHAGLECVLYYEKTSPYIKQKMIEEGIPFIIENKEVYLPFLGIALSNKNERVLPKTHKISFNTQRLLLTALYDRWDTINVSEAAKKLEVSKMAISRSFDQIQAIELPLIRETEKERLFVREKKGLWDMIMPYLRNPVLREYRVDEFLHGKNYPLGGMSALSQYSMLSDNEYPTYAITEQQEKKLNPHSFIQVPENEQPLILLHVMQYTVRYPNSMAIDPITAYLALNEAQKQDPRIKMALNKILEEYADGFGNGDFS